MMDLKVPFTVEKIAHNQIKYTFSRVYIDEIEKFSFVAISNNGMVNTEFDLGFLDEIVKWRVCKEVSESFKLFLKN